MAKLQENNPAFMANNNLSPIIMEHEGEGRDTDDYYDEVSGAGGCGCFDICCFGSRRTFDGETAGFLRYGSTGDDNYLNKPETWMMRRVKSVKQFSEVVAGPKWKNFIRKFSRKPRRTTVAQYDPQSYALNFDDAAVGDGDGDADLLLRNFSTRFAPPVSGDQRRVNL